VLFRLHGSSPLADSQRVVEALDLPVEWAGHLSVVEDDRIRVRDLPR